MKLLIKIDELDDMFFAQVEGLKCYLNYRVIDNNTLEYYRVFVPEKLRNQGIAAELVAYALNHARDTGKKIIPSCPYVKAYMDRHPQWLSIRAS